MYGGRSENVSFPDARLFRYDAPRNRWTELTPEPVHRMQYIPAGKAAAITPWGLYGFGGLGFRFDDDAGQLPSWDSFDSRVHWLHTVNKQWSAPRRGRRLTMPQVGGERS